MTTTSSNSGAANTAPTNAAPMHAAHTAYEIDPVSSRVEFTIHNRLFFVKNMMVTGRFSDVAGTITLDEQDLSTAQAVITIGAASIDTQNARRDTHLRTADFFHVDEHPTLLFRSRRVEPVDPAGGHYNVVGDLTLHGVTREVTLETHDAPAPGAGQDGRLTLTLTTPLNRRDFGMTQSNPAFKVSDELTVKLVVVATRV